MALRFIEGFDHYNSGSQLVRKWSSQSGSPTFITGRFGDGNAIQWNSGSIMKGFDSQQVWIIGFAFRTNALANLELCNFTDNGSKQQELTLVNTGALRITRNGTTLATSAVVISTNTWYNLEWKVTISNSISADTNIVRLDGTNVLNLSAATDTQQTSNSSANTFAINGGFSATTFSHDDIYICDGTGSFNNDFLGKVRVRTIIPSGNGDSSELLGSDGNSTDNYLHVDETAPDDDSTYVASGTAGQKDLYQFGDLATGTFDIRGIQFNVLARKTNVDTKSLRSLIKISGTTYESADFYLGPEYLFKNVIQEKNPNTNNQWQESEINSTQFGVKLQTAS